MNVTIKINNTSTKANSIINMLKNLAEDYDFIEIYDDESLPKSTLKELEKRLAYSLAHPEDGISWEEMEKAWKDEEEV